MYDSRGFSPGRPQGLIVKRLKKWSKGWKSRLDIRKFRLGMLSIPMGFIAFGILVTNVGCTNNFAIKGFNANSINASTPFLGNNSDNSGAFTLSRVIKSTLDSDNVLDLIGDGTGSFGNLCLPSGSGSSDSSSTSETVCTCTYSFNSSTGPVQIDVPVIYHEADLLRCNYSQTIPSTVTAVTVKVHLTSAGTFSNGIVFNFSGTGVILDPSDSKSFSKVTRYQCREKIDVRYQLDSTVYDPFQSEDPHLTYPLDFYATNLAKAIADFVNPELADANKSFDCPPILNPGDFLSGSTLSTFFSDNRVNLVLYSKAALPNGSKVMFPPQPGEFDRTTFYLSKKKSGPFSVPVNAREAPNVLTSDATPLGFGATPIPIGNGQTTCPDTSVVIPSGFHWVKVWLFGASLPPRQVAKSPAMQAVGTIACNPGLWNTATPAVGNVFPQCTTDANSIILNETQVGGAVVPGSTNHYLANRFLNSGQCVALDTSGTHPNTCGSSPGAGCNGADFWKILTGSCSALAGSGSSDPLSVCNLITPDFPSTSNIIPVDVDTTSRFDFLFVVTPQSINLSDMQNSTSASLPYQPFRFMTNTDCLSSDPDQPTSANDCSSTTVINTFGLKLHDVNSNGDPPADDPNRAGVFPVCALQPD